MAAISTNTYILSPHRPPSLPLRGSFSSSSSDLQFPFNIKQRTCLHTAAPIFTAPADAPDVLEFAPTSVTSSSWAEFAEKVSGEWDGFGADFTAEGKPIELPESVVPEAYREWEVKVFDWQTQCPTLAQSHHDRPSIMYKNIKLLPTVGCEADAATRYSVDERNLTDSSVSAFAYQSTGCYVAVWPNEKQSVELEHCLIHPSDKESRVRIIMVLKSQGSELKLKGVRVFVEQWYGPFRNGDQLGGCAIRDSAFATTQPLEASQVCGVWQGLNSTADFSASHEKVIQELGNEGECKLIRDDGDLILLPKRLWCSLKKTEDEGSCCEVGWLLDDGQAITSKCIFSSIAELKEIAIARETQTKM